MARSESVNEGGGNWVGELKLGDGHGWARVERTVRHQRSPKALLERNCRMCPKGLVSICLFQ